MTFLPKKDLLSLEELDRLCTVFIEKGVKKLRLTGGEPLVRKNIMHLVRQLSRHLESGALEELTLTTNGSQLARYAAELADCGVRRINVSLDTLDRGQVPRHHALGRPRQGDGRHRRGAGRRPEGQAQRGRAEGLQRGRTARHAALGAWPRHGPDGDRDHADGRDRRRPHRPVSAAVAAARRPRARVHADATSPTRPAALPAMSRSRRPAGGWASSRR